MKRKSLVLLTLLGLAVSFPVARYADEGMWTFDNPPLKLWKEKYGFTPTQQWLDHLRLSTVRVNTGATGAIVSPDGLIMTNQHVGRDSVSKLSTAENDYVRNGFYAGTRQGELKCKDTEITLLTSYLNVTDRVQAAAKGAPSLKDADLARRAMMAAIEKEESAKTGLKCEVITLYNGGEYWLYRFKKYTDVRLVFSPEEQIAYFGGDYDNFTYPRFCLDITFFRVYENGVPAHTENFFKWSEAGPKEGELIFVPGFPGATARLLTLAQLRYQRDTGNPIQKAVWMARKNALVKYASRGAEQARQANVPRLGLENSLKRLIGQMEGLGNPRVFRKKEDDETALRQAVARNGELQEAYGDAWTQIEMAYRGLPAMAKRLAYTNLDASRLAQTASSFVRLSDELTKPSGKRYAEFRDERLPALKNTLTSTAPFYPEMEEALLTVWLEEAKENLGGADPFVKSVLGGMSPAEVSKKAVSGSRLADPAFRRELFEGGAAAIKASQDPLLDLARKVEPLIRELRQWREENIESIEAAAGERIAKARFAVYGKNLYPDANSNLRIEYGNVAGYEQGTTLVPYKTTFFGLFDRAASFANKFPFTLPQRYIDGRGKLDLNTPLNFAYSADTIGGNSGSPVVNTKAELVGINFDGNIQKLPNRYLYIDEAEGSRAVGVHSAAIIEALTKLYGAGSLVSELRGK